LRKKRISLSPRKTKPRPRVSDPYPLRQSPFAELEETHDELEEETFSTDVTFFDVQSNQFKSIQPSEIERIFSQLRQHVPGVLAVMPVLPVPLIECNPLPDATKQPFMVAGLVAVFMKEGGPYPFGADFMGEASSAKQDHPAAVPSTIAHDLKPFHLPNLTTFDWLFSRIPKALFISSYPQQILVELEETDPGEFEKSLQFLPPRIGSLNFGYTNGPLLYHKSAKAKRPDPTVLDGSFDDTDYLLPENGGALRPGVLLECMGNVGVDAVVDGNTLSNSGVKVCKGEKQRFTCALHGWDQVPDKAVYHAGNQVGVIREALGEDIGLVETPFPFKNSLLDVNTTTQRLLHSSLLKFGEYLVIDSAFTSRQRVRCFGVRTGLRRPPPGPSSTSRYAVVNQGIFAVRSPMINSEPQLRLGMCGTPLVLLGEYLEDESYLRHGHVAGFMLWTDIKGYDVTGKLYAYCQVCDPLIDEGWGLCTD